MCFARMALNHAKPIEKVISESTGWWARGSHWQDSVVFGSLCNSQSEPSSWERCTKRHFFRTNASCDIMMWCWESTLSSWLRGAISCTRELQWNIESNQPIAPSCHKHCLICTGNYFKASFHSVGLFNVFRALPCPLTQHVVPASVASSCGGCGPPLCELYITSALTLAASGCSCAGDSTEGLQPGGALRRRWR